MSKRTTETPVEFRTIYSPGKDPVFINGVQNPLLQALTEACIVVQGELPAVQLHQLQQVKGYLNERQYAKRVGELTREPEKLRELVRSQNWLRCRYANMHLVFVLSLPKKKRELRDLAQVIQQAVSWLQGTVEAPALERSVLLNNCLVARQLLKGMLESIAGQERELAIDVTTGRSQQALTEAFAELHKPRAERQTKLRAKDLFFIDCTPNVLIVEMRKAYAEALDVFGAAERAALDLRNMRGMLHEDQYVGQLEKAAGDGGQLLALESKQHERRCIYQSYVTRLAFLKQSLESKIASLKKLLDLNECRALCTTFDGHEADENGASSMSRIFGVNKNYLVASIMSNVLAAFALVEEVEEFHLPAFAIELSKDSTDGQGALAFDKALAELAVDGELAQIFAPDVKIVKM